MRLLLCCWFGVLLVCACIVVLLGRCFVVLMCCCVALLVGRTVIIWFVYVFVCLFDGLFVRLRVRSLFCCVVVLLLC